MIQWTDELAKLSFEDAMGELESIIRDLETG
jgi:exonuclease VII small subunit